MRTIKFRAWDKEQKNMWVWESLIDKQCTYLNSKYFVAMQYTGLKDKNGKEIYEGDILHELREKTAPMADNGIDRKFEVEDIRSLNFAPNNCEVIGNIYENPELLKVLK